MASFLPNRRSFLGRLLTGVGAFSLPHMLRLRAESGASNKKTSLIVLWQDGGPSHFETFDPKPLATPEIRGALGAIGTRHAGVQFCEVLPKLAAMADKFTLIRSLNQASSGHVSATHTFVTGYVRTGTIAGPPDNPDFSVVINRMRSGHRSRVPNYVGLPSQPRGGPAYLGQAYGAFRVPGDPSQPDFKVEDVKLEDSNSPDRFRERLGILRRLDRLRRGLESSGAALDEFQKQAVDLLSSSEAARAFDLSREDPRLRERYGMHKAGQQALLARRLVEAGVSVVAVRFHPPGPWHDSWDDHPCGTHVFGTMKGRGPLVDQAVSALFEDLAQRGLDKNVLVLLAGEFGRTPRIRNFKGVPGRDHWGAAGSCVLFGGGLNMGQVIGETNRHGERPSRRPIHPRDVLATIYQYMGIDTTHEFIDHAGRPRPILPQGKPIHELA